MRVVMHILLVLAVVFCTLAAQNAVAVSTRGGVPHAVFQDTDHKNRRSPSQIPAQIRPPDVRAAKLPLPPDAQNSRTAKTGAHIASGAAPLAANGQLNMTNDWRLKIAPAAVTNGDMVLLGDIAAPLGGIDAEQWNELKTKQLWPAPPDAGKPMQINRSRLSQALRQILGNDVTGRCILPTSLVIQRGGLVFKEDDLRSYVVKSLTPQLAAMPGETELHDFRLPGYIFLANNGQRIQLEPGKLVPGRVTFRFAVQEADGTVLRRVAGMANLLLWVTVPAASRPLNKGESLTPQAVTFMRANASQLRELPWDGHGGPWRLTRGLTTGDPILQSDLVSELMVRRGNIVSLVYSRGNVHMTTKAESLADGEPGATIAVRNLQTKKQVYGTVRDGGTVEIH
ncbi:MAG: flagellar basal body P-ring formation chaperone FlgA [Desulfovibrio sp.]|nr:flagellar basal body P-ring formation chaperone FlgA [Desulfovibrio sp.]